VLVNIFFYMGHLIRLALVDDHEMFRFALAHTLRDHGFEIVAEGSDARHTFPQIDAAAPDAVLLDLNLPFMDGVTAIRELRARSPELRIMVVTASTRPRDVAAAWAAGAHGYATKQAPFPVLLDGVRRVVGGERFLAPGLSVDQEAAADPLAPLSLRERDVFRLIVRGLTSREIAKQLCISLKTVDTHRQRILKKLGQHSAVGLVQFAASNGLLDG
jgi:DNA-binding NarL/FixJ family response regulator